MRGRTKWLAAGVLALAVGGCTADGDDAGGGGGGEIAAVAPAPAPAGPEDTAGSTPEGVRGSGATVAVEPQLVRTAKLDVVVADVPARAGEAGAAARAAGGVVAGDDRSGTGRDARASLVLRVPPARLDGLLDQLARMGTEQQRSSSTEDVTEEVADIGSRVATMQASITRVRAILSRAERVGDVVAVESELSRRVGELESLQARQRALAGRTSYATVNLALSAQPTVPAAPPVERGGFLGGLQDGWRAFTAALTGLLVVLGAVLPFLIVVLPAALAARWAVRRSRRAPDPAGPPVPS